MWHVLAMVVLWKLQAARSFARSFIETGSNKMAKNVSFFSFWGEMRFKPIYSKAFEKEKEKEKKEKEKGEKKKKIPRILDLQGF